MFKPLQFCLLLILISNNILAQSNFQSKIVVNINKFRKQNKLDTLIWDQNIANAASHHARWLAKSEIKSHIESKNVLGIKTLKDLQDRFDYYKCYAFCENIVWIPNEGYYGDNILTPFEMENKMAESAVESWINSKAHRANMLSKIDGKGAIGIGISIYADSTLYAIVMNIGFPSDFKKR